MQSKNTKKIWQAPWGYPESFAVVGGIVLIGLMLQFAVGSFNFYLLAWPVNIILGAVLCLLSVIIGFKCRSSHFARFLSSKSFSVVLLLAVLFLTIIMGLTPQSGEAFTLIGFEAMTSHWSFVLVYTLTLIALGAVIVRRFILRKFSDISFSLNHLGLWLLLFSSGLGYADMQRYIMYVSEGETQWRVYDSEKNIKELPLAIKLNDFSMDFYPSRYVVVDKATGEIQKGEFTDEQLGDNLIKLVTEPEPKTFYSDIEVFSQKGQTKQAVIKVNSPLRIGHWTIYQYGYDNAAGNQSSYSSFELVYDSWVNVVYLGIILMMLGAVVMIIEGSKIKS